VLALSLPDGERSAKCDPFTFSELALKVVISSGMGHLFGFLLGKAELFQRAEHLVLFIGGSRVPMKKFKTQASTSLLNLGTIC